MAAEIHVGDYNTEYIFPLYDGEVNFDPSGATSKKLTFRNPGVTDLQERDAVAEKRTLNGVANVWALIYTVTKQDVDDGKFHTTPGAVKIQAVIDFTTGLWHSNIVTKDSAGQDIKVYANLV
jgi:hypothetical protein